MQRTGFSESDMRADMNAIILILAKAFQFFSLPLDRERK